jgi:phosphatidylinositol alpha-1,6-mannosyltransferase
MRRHLLVTNDFPPKVGGIQSYLWELWRRLPPESFAVLTSPYDGAPAFDREQAFEVVRTLEPVLLPSPLMVARVERMATRFGADFVVVDPAVPLGLIGPSLSRPYVPVLHGAEVTVPGRLPLSRNLLGRVLRGAAMVVSAGGYPEEEGRRAAGERFPPVARIPPGVDVQRFAPLSASAIGAVRSSLGLSTAGPLVVSVSRLVPRKGMDVLIEASARLRRSGRHPDLTVAIAGSGRDRQRLDRLIARTGAPVKMLGRVTDEMLPMLYGAADVFALCCRSRWWGLEQEGFGIVLLEAAAAGVACIAGSSGGAAEAVDHGVTGLVVDDPEDVAQVADALERLLSDEQKRRSMGAAGRRRAETEFSYDVLAERLAGALETVPGGAP